MGPRIPKRIAVDGTVIPRGGTPGDAATDAEAGVAVPPAPVAPSAPPGPLGRTKASVGQVGSAAGAAVDLTVAGRGRRPVEVTAEEKTALGDKSARRVLTRHMAATPLTFWGRVLEAQVGALGGEAEAAAALYETSGGHFVLELVVPDGSEHRTSVRHAMEFASAEDLAGFLERTRLHQAAIEAAMMAVVNAAHTVPRLKPCGERLAAVIAANAANTPEKPASTTPGTTTPLTPRLSGPTSEVPHVRKVAVVDGPRPAAGGAAPMQDMLAMLLPPTK